MKSSGGLKIERISYAGWPNCIRVTNGCCDCANGGDTTAVSREFDKKFEKLFSCEKTMCTQKAGDCNFREPVCVNHLCALGPNKELFPKKKEAGPLPPVQPSSK